MLVGEDSRKGRWKEEEGVGGCCDREGIVWRASRASSWHWSPVGAGRVSGLLFWLVKDVFFPTFLFFFWARCHLTVDHRQGLVGQPAVSVTNCHWHCLSSLTGWTDDGRLNGRHHSARPHLLRPQTQHTEESSIFIPSPTSGLLFCVLSHSYVNAEIKHMVLICNKSTVTQADFLLWIFIVRVTRRPAPVCVWSLALFITKVCWQRVSTKAQQAYEFAFLLQGDIMM